MIPLIAPDACELCLGTSVELVGFSFNKCVLTLAAFALHLLSATVLENWSPSQLINRASIFARCWGTMLQFSTELIACDGKSGTETK